MEITTKQNEFSVIFVLGMHRSGTSALTGALITCGIGVDSNLVRADPIDNPKGYWEPVDVVSINDDIFAAFNMHYMDFFNFPNGWLNDKSMDSIKERIAAWFDRSFKDHSTLVLKDPRLCRTLPIWLEVVKEKKISAKYIHVFRHPSEVIASLQTRDRLFKPDVGMYIWLTYVLGGISDCLVGDMAIVSYDSLVNNPTNTLTIVGEYLSILFNNALSDMTMELNRFIDPTLKRQQRVDLIPNSLLDSVAQELFNALRDYDLKKPDARFFDRLKSIREQFGKLQTIASLADQNIVELRDQLVAEKKNATAQIQYREALLVELRDQLVAKKKTWKSIFGINIK